MDSKGLTILHYMWVRIAYTELLTTGWEHITKQLVNSFFSVNFGTFQNVANHTYLI